MIQRWFDRLIRGQGRTLCDGFTLRGLKLYWRTLRRKTLNFWLLFSGPRMLLALEIFIKRTFDEFQI